MTVPRAFKVLVSRLGRDPIPQPFVEKIWIAAAVSSMRDEDKAVALQFLEKLLSGNPSGEMLRKVWDECEPEYHIAPIDKVGAFFEIIRKELSR